MCSDSLSSCGSALPPLPPLPPAVVSEGEDPHVVGCEFDTPRFSVIVVQISGWDMFMQGHAEAVAYYTW